MRYEASCTDQEIQPWPDWSGQTAVCIATGPSLTPDQIECVRSASVRSIGINDVGLTEQWVDIWYAADFKFWQHYQARAEMSGSLKVCADKKMLSGGIADRFLNTRDKDKALRFEPGYAISGGHSGCQALQLAISLGATKVVLLGYDCKPDGSRTNYFGQKCPALNKGSDYELWRESYRTLAIPDDVEVLNATPGSAIDVYPMVEIERAL